MRIELVLYIIYMCMILVYRTQIQSYSTMFILYRYLAKIIYGPKYCNYTYIIYREYKIIYSEQQLSTSQVSTMNSWSSVLFTFIYRILFFYIFVLYFILVWKSALHSPQHIIISEFYIFEFICICLTNWVIIGIFDIENSVVYCIDYILGNLLKIFCVE